MAAQTTSAQLHLLLQRVDELREDMRAQVDDLREEVRALRSAMSELCVQGAKRNGAVAALEHRVGVLEARVEGLPCTDHTQKLAELGKAEKGNQTNWNRVASAVIQVIVMVTGIVLGYVFGGGR